VIALNEAGPDDDVENLGIISTDSRVAGLSPYGGSFC